MDESGEQPKFEIQPVIEQMPFKYDAVGNFFREWCLRNDSIEPHIVSREFWQEKAKTGILEKTPHGHNVYVPHDLRLWEMVGIFEAIDRDTFADNPIKQTEGKDKVMALGRLFQNSGIYIAQRLDGIKEGKPIAKGLSREFFDYGSSLITGKKPSKLTPIKDISKLSVSDKETEKIDKFLAGESLYLSRQKKAEKLTLKPLANPSRIIEQVRRRTLNQFFRVTQKAYMLSDDNSLHKTPEPRYPWLNDTPIHQEFILTLNKALSDYIKLPLKELTSSIFRRGMELLRQNMPFDKLPTYIKDIYLHWQNGEKTLREALDIKGLKSQLAEVVKSGNLHQISTVERNIVDIIQAAVSSYPYRENVNNPSKMIANQELNCVGASTLGAAFMTEVGLNYLVGHVPKHSVLFLITSDGHVEWRDMLNPMFNEDLADSMIKGKNNDGSPLTVADIVEFSLHPSPRGLLFDIASPNYHQKVRWLPQGQRQYLGLFAPREGILLHQLINTGVILRNFKQYSEAEFCLRQAINLNPQHDYLYNNLGDALLSDKQYSEAIRLFRQAIRINPDFYEAYDNLGTAYIKIKEYNKAETCYRQSVKINNTYASPHYNLGYLLSFLNRKHEALNEYKLFIEFADQEKDVEFINAAKEQIEKLSKEIQINE